MRKWHISFCGLYFGFPSWEGHRVCDTHSEGVCDTAHPGVFPKHFLKKSIILFIIIGLFLSFSYCKYNILNTCCQELYTKIASNENTHVLRCNLLYPLIIIPWSLECITKMIQSFHYSDNIVSFKWNKRITRVIKSKDLHPTMNTSASVQRYDSKLRDVSTTYSSVYSRMNEVRAVRYSS